MPIIALTADAVIENRPIYLEAGCDVVATKPIDWAILADHIARLLGHEAVATPPEPALTPPSAPPAAHWRDLPLLNRPLLDELVDSLGKDTLSALVSATVENLRAYVVQLRQLAAAHDFSQMMRLAHQIKGASGQVGAERVSGIARAIESESKDGAMASAAIDAIDDSLSPKRRPPSKPILRWPVKLHEWAARHPLWDQELRHDEESTDVAGQPRRCFCIS